MRRLQRYKLTKLTPFRILVSYYFFTVALSAGLLSLPFARKVDADWSFMDAIFTAASAVSVTGLSTISIADTFNVYGIFLLMLVLQIGGIGIMTISTFFWLFLGKKIGLKHRQLIRTDQNQINLAGLVGLLKQIVFLILLIEAIGALVLGMYYLNYFHTWQEAFLQGLFASVSATTNAGFDITGESLIPFAKDYFVQFVTMLLIILGAIGFPVWIEVKRFLLHKDEKVRFRFSLFTKITTATYFLLLVVGTLIIFIFEYNGYFADKSWHQSFFYALFQSTTMRSAGLLTLDINQLSISTILFMSTLMFIGASPSSVGGGIRTTTFALNILFLFHFARGNTTIKIFKREIHQEDVIKALVVLMLAVILSGTSILLLSITEDASLIAIIFEVASAFGTCGASMGITPYLTDFGKSLLILLMFIGRIGILSFLFTMASNEKAPDYHYPKERVIIG
ncbi:TrkH family potassium uptake protein [Lederbergia citrea]|uniref:TrkH family potassium uptake protein n=1 Tax=Lederbergia citrea TaxID=2833581 RepID=A0A942Z1F0_9BACI|nr:TrkH family potassium uptake protein [Lederbergia citrea]MBS4203988.1 TrkH family potassium uptake protein [Lederbergia citrea]MBS4221428.1 TrkH family potassium uptake protein [Lederbergia citrea]